MTADRSIRIVGPGLGQGTARGTAQLLADIVEADDAYTAQHCRDVVDLSLAVADRLGLGAAARRRVELGALLHDVGKLAIPDAILQKPGRLTTVEWEIMREHTAVGGRMLAAARDELAEIAPIVRASHERWDGRGYPDGLKREAIPIEARIVAACDAYSAITTDRPYRKALSAEHAIAELRDGAGWQFDPAVVAALIAVLAAPVRRSAA